MRYKQPTRFRAASPSRYFAYSQSTARSTPSSAASSPRPVVKPRSLFHNLTKAQADLSDADMKDGTDGTQHLFNHQPHSTAKPRSEHTGDRAEHGNFSRPLQQKKKKRLSENYGEMLPEHLMDSRMNKMTLKGNRNDKSTKMATPRRVTVSELMKEYQKQFPRREAVEGMGYATSTPAAKRVKFEEQPRRHPLAMQFKENMRSLTELSNLSLSATIGKIDKKHIESFEIVTNQTTQLYTTVHKVLIPQSFPNLSEEGKLLLLAKKFTSHVQGWEVQYDMLWQELLQVDREILELSDRVENDEEGALNESYVEEIKKEMESVGKQWTKKLAASEKKLVSEENAEKTKALVQCF